MENANEKLIRYLQDAHAAEVGIRKLLSGYADDTDNPTLKALFTEHVQLTRTHEDRIAQCLRNYNQEPSGGKGFFNSLMSKIAEMVQSGHDDEDKNTQFLIKAYAAEHLECGMYESLIAFAGAVGDEKVVEVAKSIQAEEKATADRIWPMIREFAVSAVKTTATAGKAYTA